MNTSQPDLRLVTPEAPEEPDGPDPNIGQTLDGRYLIERMLGKGGMGLVYAARHVILQKPLAVKVLKEEVSRDEGVMARFRREAQSASAIGSAHICDVNDFGTLPDGSTYLVMEFLDGPPLTDVLENDAPIPIPRILDIVIQLCDALGAAHEVGIVHRDLKPDNVHLVEQGGKKDFVKVLDFGIAKVGGAAGKKLTQAGQVFGTPHYMSPEQCGGREVDHRTDIYALGVMLYEMTCGVVPFDADNLMGVLTKHVYENPIPPREFPPPVHVSPGLEAVILRALAKQPEHRYQSMAEFRTDLASVLEGETPSAVMHAVGGPGVAGTQIMGSAEVSGLIGAFPASPAAADMFEKPKGKSPVLLIVLGVVAILILGGAAFGAAFFLTGEEPAEVVADGTGATDSAGTNADPTPVNPIEATAATETGSTETGATETGATETGATETGSTETGSTETAAVVMITVQTEPAGAEVYGDDDALLGNSPLQIPQPAADAEPINLTFRLAGYRDRTVPVSHLSGETLTISLNRQRAGRPRRPARPQTRPVQPQIRTMGSTAPAPRRPPPSTGGGSGEIINPW